MRQYFILLVIIILIGCKEKSSESELVMTYAKTQDQIKREGDEKRVRMEIAKVGNLAPVANILDQDSIIISTEVFKGKLLIIDFWATWCSPCISEIPKFKDLEKKYESDKVEFITVSIDDPVSFWKDYITENNWETNNYWFGTKESHPFFSYMYSEMEVEDKSVVLISLPKYVIISPKGKILNNQAAKPSDPEFEKEIALHIKNYALS